MTDAECLELLRWAAPHLGLRYEGFRRVRGQVCKRVGRRMKALGVRGLAAYLQRLGLCRNVAFTYFARPLQLALLGRLLERLVPGGLLATGAHESLPEGATGLVRAAGALPLFLREMPHP